MSSPAIRNVSYLLTPKRSPMRKNCVTHDRVSRNLFSPVSQQSLGSNHFTTPIRRKDDLRDGLSFDTPQRNLLSPSGFRSKVKQFVLGSGSYGTVVKGKYKNNKVAVKIIPKKMDLLSENSTNRETNALQLNHPNIVQVFRVVQQSGTGMGFVFMEQVNNTNLESLLQKEIIPFKIKLRYLKEIASALEYCHKNNVLHLDVKPKNVIVNALSNSCKLCDFGNSINKADSKKLDAPSKGTLRYTAPELLRGKTASEKADTYSFGITMWQVLYQETPFGNEDLHIVVYKVVTQNYRPKTDKLLACDGNIECTFKACWELEADNRPSMSKVLGLLQNIKLRSDTKKCLL